MVSLSCMGVSPIDQVPRTLFCRQVGLKRFDRPVVIDVSNGEDPLGRSSVQTPLVLRCDEILARDQTGLNSGLPEPHGLTREPVISYRAIGRANVCYRFEL